MRQKKANIKKLVSSIASKRMPASSKNKLLQKVYMAGSKTNGFLVIAGIILGALAGLVIFLKPQENPVVVKYAPTSMQLRYLEKEQKHLSDLEKLQVETDTALQELDKLDQSLNELSGLVK